jgi:bifunctional non-homologous end joining protein LigD
LICNDEATLQYLVNLGCIDINPWTSRISSPDTPDFIIIDLDPSDEDFTKAIEVAKTAKKIFDKNKILAFPKTSGKTGIHLYLPCNEFNFVEARIIAGTICNAIHELIPLITTTDVGINNRGNKLYLDPNQNDFADTVAAPYSVRPFYRPTVSTPLEWKEINSKLDPGKFTTSTILDRLKKKGDLFKNVLDKKIADSNNRQLKNFL